MVAHAGISTSAMKKYRGVRQRQWGSWVSEIRHSLSKTRVWLGTFDTAKKAAKAYDEAARLMEGPNAKTNFPTPAGAPVSPSLLSAAVRAKLLQCTLRGPKPAQRASSNSSAPSTRSTALSAGQTLVCLRLDDTQDQLGVTWQATSDARARWVTTLHVPAATATTSSPNKRQLFHNRHDLGAQIQQMGAAKPPALPLDSILTAADIDQLAAALQPSSPLSPTSCSSNDDGTTPSPTPLSSSTFVSWFLAQEHEHVDAFDSSEYPAVAAAAALFSCCEHEQSSSPFLVDYGSCGQVYEDDDCDLGLCFPQQQLWL